MVAIVYPSTLPAPSGWNGTPFERRAASPLPGNTQLRGRWRDALQDIDARWFFTAPEMAIWVAWYEQTLLNGMLWFAATVPGSGGFILRVLKYRTSTVKRTLLGNGVFEVTARMQQRGISAAPQADPLPTYLFRDTFTGTIGTSLVSHAPEAKPSGFAWGTTDLVLSGAGSIDGFTGGSITSDVSVAAGFSTTLPAVFNLQITAYRPATGVSESEYFIVGEDGSGTETFVKLFAQDLGVQARVYCAGTLKSYAVIGSLHTVRLRVNGDGTASSYVDGVFQETFACDTPAAVITHMKVRVDYEPGAIGSISEVSIFH